MVFKGSKNKSNGSEPAVAKGILKTNGVSPSENKNGDSSDRGRDPNENGDADGDGDDASVSVYSESEYSGVDDHSITSLNSAHSGTTGIDSATKGSNGKNASEIESEVRKLAQKENQAVRMWRLIVIVLFLVVGAIVSTATYIFLTRQEEEEYQSSYVTSVDTARDATSGHIQNLHQAFQGIAALYTETALKENMTWPYVTLPAFEVHGQHARAQSGVELFAIAPLVQESERQTWLEYSQTHAHWIEQSRRIAMAYEENDHDDVGHGVGLYDTSDFENYANDSIATDFYRPPDNQISDSNGPHLPLWQVSPPPYSKQYVNWNLKESPQVYELLPAVTVAKVGLFTDVYDLKIVSGVATNPLDHYLYHKSIGPVKDADSAYDHPHSIFLQPVFRSHDVDDIVAVFAVIFPWDRYLINLLPEGRNGIIAVLTNNCGQSYTYELRGNTPVYLGEGDMHDPAYESTKSVIPFIVPNSTSHVVAGHCEYSFVLYASEEYQSASSTSTPVIFTAVVAIVFVAVILTFFVYDRFVQRRNDKVIDAATRSNAILSSLFPKNVRQRLFEQEQQKALMKKNGSSMASYNVAGKTRLRTFLSDSSERDETNTGSEGPSSIAASGRDGGNETLGYEGAPIADLFPDCTVLFADIAGFTAWSSVREPAQVFTLLETLYRAFDQIAKRRRVFKVETIGDCYVAVTGLPDPNKDHAVSMARFARECTNKMRVLVKKLEISLGPDTGDLCLRTGMHSGPVTAGVLRGERSRFQLFGDTMNTASRMESTGMRDRIQVSQDTADLLIAAGKEIWLTKRKEKVVAKGKGEMQTYWVSLNSNGGKTTSNASSSENNNRPDHELVDVEHAALQESKPKKPIVEKMSAEKTERLIEWNVDVLHRLLKQIVARRQAERIGFGLLYEEDDNAEDLEYAGHKPGGTTIDEVAEIITLPKFDAQAAMRQADPDSIQLPTEVVDQLYDYVFNIAAMYNDNPFHNFEHASHVTMSVVKLLSRIVAPSEIEFDENDETTGKTLHDHTYGITSDPLTQFACVFSALIHDADHSGVPNAQLVKEKSHIAEYYDGKSVAEQNSVDLAWHLLMDGSYSDLCRTIYSTQAELNRFRQLVVNSVMATDIVDKELKTLRNARWAKAFSEAPDENAVSHRDAVNRKATIVIEHLIQASDVAHTMQHWHIYRKWNERFFIECYKAYIEGRAEKDPAEGWYQGEMGFYDFYIIPLAKKLKDCGVFGVSSDEYLNYAVRNRKEWEDRGKEVVDEMVNKVRNAHWANARPESAPPVASS